MLPEGHPEINKNAWSVATTTDPRRSTHDARPIYTGGIFDGDANENNLDFFPVNDSGNLFEHAGERC